MKFTCDRQVLAKTLNTVSKAVSVKTTMPILKGILLEVKGGYLRMTASNLDISIEKVMQVEGQRDGSVVVMAKLFGEIIRKLKNGPVTIEQNQEGNIIIKNASAEFTIIGFPVDEFPNITEDEDKEKYASQITLDKHVFEKMIEKTSFAASIEEAKGVLVGILVEISEGKINMVALDGFRMAIASEKVDLEGSSKIIIPAKILNDISRIISESDEDDNDNDEIVLFQGDKKAAILMENTRIVLRLISGEYLRYNDLLPKAFKCKLIASREDLTESIERADLLAKEGKNKLIKLQISGDTLVITSKSEEGRVIEEISIEHEGDDIEIGFNSKYLLDVLKVLDDEKVMLEFNTSINPCILRPAEGENFKYLILPVRI